MMDGMLSTYLEQVKDRVNSCEEFYELQQQQWQESIQLRTEEGIVKTIAGVGTMILGGILIVATCGMALPLVATVGVAAIGLGTAAYGCTNAVEGGQDVYAGVTGDPRMVSVNPIRDTVFASNPDLYYLIGNVLTIAASLILTGGMAANAAVSAGTSIGRAVVTEYAKQGLTVAASSYVDKRMTEATNSPLAGFVVGSLTGMATYGTLSETELEVVNNVKRPQQLGNVGESGTSLTKRPSWRQAELDAAKDFPDYLEQKSFIKGKEVPYGTKGSVRPDLYKDGFSIDVKNYQIETASGRSNLARNIEKQYYQRIGNLPEGTEQSVLIDIRGQNISQNNLNALYNDIVERTSNGIKVRFKES